MAVDGTVTSPRRPMAVSAICVVIGVTAAILGFNSVPQRTFLIPRPVAETAGERSIQYNVVRLVDGRFVVEKDEHSFIIPSSREVDEEVEIPISPQQWLRISIYWVIAIFYGAYGVFVLVLWMCDKVLKKRKSRATADNERRLQGLITFAVGSLTGLLASGSSSADADLQAKLMSLDGRNRQYQQEIDTLNQSLASFVTLLSGKSLLINAGPITEAVPEPATYNESPGSR